MYNAITRSVSYGNPVSSATVKRYLFRIVFGLFLFLTGFSFAVAQDLTKNYSRLSSSGNLPTFFVENFQTKIKAEGEIIRSKNDSTLREREDFTSENIFDTDRLIRSGNVLFNDSISRYVNRVLDEILKNDVPLRSKLQLFVVKSVSTNAFSFDNGIILINTGLLSQLENEAELAFILCHELVHYRKRHSVNAYLNYVNLTNNSYRKTSNHEAVLNYSRDQETEADTAGLAMFRTTSYDYCAVRSAFDVMQYAYLPFDEQPFPKTFFEDKNLKFPADYFLDKTASIKNEDNYDDSKSTHPNIRKRRSSVLRLLDSTCYNSGRKRFLVSESSFLRSRELARFETCSLYLLNLDYADAIYSAFLLQQRYPDNLFLKKVIAKALYGIAAYKETNYGTHFKNDVFSADSRYELKAYDQVEGYSQQVYYLFHKLSSEEATVLALRYSWKLHTSLDYRDKELAPICDSLFAFLVMAERKGPSDFSTKTRLEVIHDDSLLALTTSHHPASDTASIASNKYERIKAEQRKDGLKTDEPVDLADFTEYAFADLLKDKNFSARFQFFVNRKAEKGSLDNYESYQEKEKDAHRELKNGKALGVNKVVIVEPFYYRVKAEGNQKLDLDGTAKGILELRKTIKEDAAKAGIDYVAIDPQQMTAGETDRYNDFSKINDWFSERLLHGYHAGILASCSEEMKQLAARYGSPYFLWTGVISMHKGSLGSKGTFIYVVLYDVTNETPLFAESRQVHMKDSPAMLHSNFYDIFHQFHQQPRKKKADKAITN
jgi:Zn-dependent protease with chaperone function